MSAPTRLGLLAPLMGALCLSGSAKGAQNPEFQARLNGGYYLFHNLCEDEAKVPVLLVIKTAPSSIEKYADRISKTAKESMAAVEKMHDHDPSLKFDVNPLPTFEKEVREATKADEQHQLLFGTKGPDFVRAFLVAQIEASNYACHLSKVLAKEETDPDRARKLRDLSSQWQALDQEAFRLLGEQ